MSAARVIEAINVLEDSDLNRSACLPGMPPDQFCFDGFEEGFHRGVVITIALATHRYLEAMQAQQLLIIV